MEHQFAPMVHLSEDFLETYALNRLSEEETCRAEEHLLICPTCQKTLKGIDEYILLMKAATAGYLENPPPERSTNDVVRLRMGFIHDNAVDRLPIAIWALVLCGICVSALTALKLESRHATATAPVAVSLMALRGEGIVTVVPAGARLDLAIDMTGLQAERRYRLQAVNATGQPVWDATAIAGGGRLVAQVSQGLKPGIYWVRLYSDGELIREFGLKVSG